MNFTFENFEGQDEVSSEASALQREEVELAKPFLIWHVMKTSHWRVARLGALSSWFISALLVGALAAIAYSRCRRTMAQYSGVNAVLDSSQKDLRP